MEWMNGEVGMTRSEEGRKGGRKGGKGRGRERKGIWFGDGGQASACLERLLIDER